MIALLGPLWPILGRTALFMAVDKIIKKPVYREIAKSLIVDALERNITPTVIQVEYAKRAGNEARILDTQAGTTEFIGKILEKVSRPELRSPGASYLAESITVHHLEGGKQRTTALLAMQCAVTDDEYYPLLVLCTAFNSRPLFPQDECALEAALLWVHYHTASGYSNIRVRHGKKPYDSTNTNAVRAEIAEDSGYFDYFYNMVLVTYKTTVGDVADNIKNSSSWLRLGNFCLQVKRMLEVLGEPVEHYDPVHNLRKAMDKGAVSMSDDRQKLHLIDSESGFEHLINVGKEMDDPLFRAAFHTSISGGANFPGVSRGSLSSKMADLKSTSRFIQDPRTRNDLAEALIELAENVKRDFA